MFTKIPTKLETEKCLRVFGPEKKGNRIAMARRHRHMAGFRIFLVLAIPSMYYLCISLSGLFSKTSTGEIVSNFENIRSRKLLQLEENVSAGENLNCTPPAIKEFPPDGFTRSERQSGYIAIHFILAIYMFLLLAIVCDDFFVPSIKKICENINITKDVAGATFMAAATSSPELFINVVGTFITEGDLGIGTIVGSAVFNILAVPACCGLFASQVLDLEWWPISRDSLAYGFTVILLIATLHDGRIEWYEALILVISYILYILAMCFNKRISRFMNLSVSKRRKYKNLNEESPLITSNKITDSLVGNQTIRPVYANGKDSTFSNNNCSDVLDMSSLEFSSDDSLEIVNITSWPNPKMERLWWVFTWPINLLLLITIPDCRRPSLRNYYPLTFIMCIAWIASMSYMVAWDITIIGDTLKIPDSVMGLTFLAAGMSVPEAVSSVIVTNQGHGTMGISNSIGSNIFDVLLCLGLPWFIKSIFSPKVAGDHSVKINSEGLVYSSASLFSTLILLYVVIASNKFKLDRRVGFICLSMYSVFLVFAAVVELNIFFVVNKPTCLH
ncbi:sodium/potassium/calcium exchanger 4-like [Belonocnema kinseyi]|uniref:sodium/potassium/calcium exchanger 4-like n=1 Tax=Belonocnema kinseyi TaxID=2817044 RepID=UPI00143DFABB|nr:sodium/potassium/calcium exchanger 4-like [Belonocnema kinseyi]